MKQLLVLAGCCVILSVLAGCQGMAGIAGGSKFPEFLVGRWDSAKGYWKIVFAADGSISAVGNPITRARLIPNETAVVKLLDGRENTFKLGDCTADYSPDTRELAVFIDVEHVRRVYGPDDYIEGSQKEVFVGTVSEDGTTYEADWTCYYAYGERPATDPNVISRHVIFRKVTD